MRDVPRLGESVVMSQGSDDVACCPRCASWMKPRRPWPHWRKARTLYYSGFGLALCAGPVVLADAFVLIPTLMLYLSAAGPLNSFVRQQATCTRCGSHMS
jgi:ribosomal protein S27AE